MLTLILGGTRSGKSVIAEAAAEAAGGPVTYLATAIVDPTDADHVARVGAHRSRRPGHWETVECCRPRDLVDHLDSASGVVLVDSIGTWLTLHDDLLVDSSDLLRALERREAPSVVVSEEVGLAIHAPSEMGRRYVDALGLLNQQIAAVADRVLLVVAGRSIELGAPPSPSGTQC